MAAEPTKFGYYLYGIFPQPGPPALEIEGLDKAPVESAAVAEFVFLYSAAQQERYLASRRNILAHTKVLERAMEMGYRTLLPLRFGLVAESWEAIARDLIELQGEALRQRLEELAGKREVSVKLYWEFEPELQRLLQEDAQLKAERDRLEGKLLGMDETIAIGQAIERGMEARKAAIAARFQDELAPLATEIRENEAMTEAMIYNAAFLIPWESEPDFSERVEALDREFESRLKIRYNNFTPPYNFADLE